MSKEDDSHSGRRIFISYPRGGAAHTWAEQVHTHLQDLNSLVWRDEVNVKEGDSNWYERINLGLLRAEAVVCIVGNESEACRWQEREMLRADQLGIPIVALRVAPVRLPFYMIEKQPIEPRALQADTMRVLAEALADQLAARASFQHPRLASTTATVAASAEPKVSAPKAARRQRELTYLNDLLYGNLSTHEARYEPLAGVEQRAPTLDRTHKGLTRSLRIDSTMLLKAFNQSSEDEQPCDLGHQPKPSIHADVLDVFVALPKQRVPRLAVLGEPGAGKSFALERVAVDYARRALYDTTAPLPLLVKLGSWTREGESLQARVEDQLGVLGRDFTALRDRGRCVLLLDGLNEIPSQQRRMKAQQVLQMVEDARFAAVLVSCRERDFDRDFALPFDRLTLQALTPLQIHRFLHRTYRLNCSNDAEGSAKADQRFWQLAGGPAVQKVWRVWRAAGATIEHFWSAEEVPQDIPNVFSYTTGEQNQTWHTARHDPRSLIKLAANPYLLSVIALLPTVPRNRAELFQGFLQILHERERKAREAQGNGRNVPELEKWLTAMADLARAMQHLSADNTDEDETNSGAATSLPLTACPSSLTEQMLSFALDTGVLQRNGQNERAQLRFTHQLLQEALASSVFTQASQRCDMEATHFWPPERWWLRNGWEVVAELAAEHCANDLEALWTLLTWLVCAQPEVASHAWLIVGKPTLPPAFALKVRERWGPCLEALGTGPDPAARAAIGRALAAFGLDDRPGIGLRADGRPDIVWARIADGKSFRYQGKPHPPLPSFDIARYPITNRQYQAFIDDRGYEDERWWSGVGERMDFPTTPEWADSNAPRENVSWWEAMAFCRWLSEQLGESISLPTEHQWERAAGGLLGMAYPWGTDYQTGRANCCETDHVNGSEMVNDLGRTTSVGIYPDASVEGVHDLAGNVWEWVADKFDVKEKQTNTLRVLRGGSWFNDPHYLRSTSRIGNRPIVQCSYFGFRVCRNAHIDRP